MWSGNNNKKYSEIFNEIDEYLNSDEFNSYPIDKLYKKIIISNAFWVLQRVKNQYQNVSYDEKIGILMNYVKFDFSKNRDLLITEMVDTFSREIGSLSQKRKYIDDLEGIENARNIDLSKYKKMILECPRGDGLLIYEGVMSRLIFNDLNIKPMELHRGNYFNEFAEHFIELDNKKKQEENDKPKEYVYYSSIDLDDIARNSPHSSKFMSELVVHNYGNGKIRLETQEECNGHFENNI